MALTQKTINATQASMKRMFAKHLELEASLLDMRGLDDEAVAQGAPATNMAELRVIAATVQGNLDTLAISLKNLNAKLTQRFVTGSGIQLQTGC